MASIIKGILFLPTWKKSLPGAASREGPSTDLKPFKLWLTSPETFFCFAVLSPPCFLQTLINADKPVFWKAWYGTDGFLHALGVDFPLVLPHSVIFIVGSGCQVLHYRWEQEKQAFLFNLLERVSFFKLLSLCFLTFHLRKTSASTKGMRIVSRNHLVPSTQFQQWSTHFSPLPPPPLFLSKGHTSFSIHLSNF